MQKLILLGRPRSVPVLSPFVRLIMTFTLICSWPSHYMAGQAVKLRVLRPRPQLFAFTTFTVTASPTTVNFTLVHGGAATGSAVVAITTAYAGGISLNGTINMYGYFTSAANALTGGSPSSSISSANVLGMVPTGIPTSFTAFTQTTPFSGASGLELYTASSILILPGSRTDNLSLKIDLTSAPQQPAATYIGTLSLEAQAF